MYQSMPSTPKKQKNIKSIRDSIVVQLQGRVAVKTARILYAGSPAGKEDLWRASVPAC